MTEWVPTGGDTNSIGVACMDDPLEEQLQVCKLFPEDRRDSLGHWNGLSDSRVQKLTPNGFTEKDLGEVFGKGMAEETDRSAFNRGIAAESGVQRVQF